MIGDPLGQAMSHHRQGRPRDAVASLDQALARAPSRWDAWKLRGQIMLEHAAYRDALASFDRALAVQPHDADIWALRGDTLRLLSQNDHAVTAYRQAAGLNPHHARALNGMGLIAAQRGQPQAALAHHDHALAIDQAC